MKKNYLKQKGFTLVEILIVVVILAILAALILPRLLSQPERAVISEAQQMLGTLRRAQQTRMDTTGNNAYLALTCGTVASPGCSSNAVLSQLGIRDIENTASFAYSCSGTLNSCTATRAVPATDTFSGAAVTLTDNGTFTCATPYISADSSDASKGCAI